ncbi:MAG: phosphatidate cytidylyltransferase, partial [Planctomycetota bacterium]
RGSGRGASRWGCLTATGIVSLSVCIPMFWPLFGRVYPANCPVGRLGWVVITGVVALFLILGIEMWRYKPHREAKVGEQQASLAAQRAIERTVGGVFVAMYVGLPMALIAATRMLGEGTWGLAALLTVIATTKSSDTGAYFVGRALGRAKLIPRLSPGKTQEGAVGGIAVATFAAFLCLQFLFPWIAASSSTPLPSTWWALVLGPALAVSGMLGDLAESLVKRDAGAKDSGNWLPGMGGVWDVSDSLIAAAMPGFMVFAAAL